MQEIEFDENIVYILAIKLPFVKIMELYRVAYVWVCSISVFLQDMKTQYYFINV